MSLLEKFCHVDDFCIHCLPKLHARLITNGKPKRRRERGLSLSEVMTILIAFHSSGYRTFKDYYTKYVLIHWQGEFPGLVSYNRFVEFIPDALLGLAGFLRVCQGECSGINYLDSTPWKVCHNLRIRSHRVFAGLAQRGKSSTGWFFGFKVHLVVNHLGELVSVVFTPGNCDDRMATVMIVSPSSIC